MSLLTDILLVGSAVAFVAGVLALFIKPIRIKQKTRYYFLAAFMLFGLSLTFGWSDFVDGFNNCCDSSDETIEKID